MLTLYGNAFSPFARKVQLILEHKGIDYEYVDGLARDNRDRLMKVNKRIEVPAIDHDGLIVVNSADIAAYLERVFPYRPVYPSDTKIFADDMARTKTFLSDPATMGTVERNKIFWRGDRIEWILARGYHDWFMKEITDGRVIWPEYGAPA